MEAISFSRRHWHLGESQATSQAARTSKSSKAYSALAFPSQAEIAHTINGCHIL